MARTVRIEFPETDKTLRVLGQRRRILPGRRQDPRSNCVLDVSKLLSAGVPLRPVEEALIDSLQNWMGSTGDSPVPFGASPKAPICRKN